MRARIEQIDDSHEAHIYEASMDDLRSVVDLCRAQQDAGQTGDRDMRVLAHIPDIVVQQYMNDKGVSYAEFIRNPEHATRMLNDPALSGFRVSRGRV